MKQKGNVVRDEDFLDPFTGQQRGQAIINTTFEAGKVLEQTAKARAKAQDALDKKI